MGMTSPFPEPESPDLERFAVYARVEIVAVLRQLLEAGVLVTAYFDQGPGFCVTIPLMVNEDFEEVIFDYASDELATKRLLASKHITFVAFLENVKLQFTVHVAEATTFEGKSAFRVRLPEQLLRMQRRDFFRIAPPMSKPAQVLVPYAGDGKQYEKLRVLDISVGGMAVMSYPEKFDLPLAAVIDNCYLDLPGFGSVSVVVHVRHVDVLPRDQAARRVGCEFVDMAPASRVMLQRYINRLDAERRKLSGSSKVA